MSQVWINGAQRNNGQFWVNGQQVSQLWANGTRIYNRSGNTIDINANWFTAIIQYGSRFSANFGSGWVDVRQGDSVFPINNSQTVSLEATSSLQHLDIYDLVTTQYNFVRWHPSAGSVGNILAGNTTYTAPADFVDNINLNAEYSKDQMWPPINIGHNLGAISVPSFEVSINEGGPILITGANRQFELAMERYFNINITTAFISNNFTYEFDRWELQNSGLAGIGILTSTTNNSTTFYVPRGSTFDLRGRHVTAFFAQRASLSINRNPIAGGTVTGVGTYNPNTSVNIVATPASGYSFINWSIVSGTATFGNSTSSATTVTLSNNTVIQANFGTSSPVIVITDHMTWIANYLPHFRVNGTDIRNSFINQDDYVFNMASNSTALLEVSHSHFEVFNCPNSQCTTRLDFLRWEVTPSGLGSLSSSLGLSTVFTRNSTSGTPRIRAIWLLSNPV
jgi:hypothetical protein